MNSFAMPPVDTLRAQPAPLTPLCADGDTLPRNRLIQHARRLLDALVEVRLYKPPETSVLRNYLIREVRAFQAQAHHAGLPAETIVAARYCLCTALDEVVALTPWGRAEAWSSNGLLVAFHNETWGGEKFFQLLARLAARPHLHIDLMELQYVCLALGFQGRYHVIRDGAVKLEGLRRRLYQLLASTRQPVPEALSPRWRAADSMAAPHLRPGLPPWSWVAIAALVAGVSLAGFRFAIDSRAHRTESAIAALHLPEVSEPVRDDIVRWLATDIDAGLLTVHNTPDSTIISIRGDGAFASGSAEVDPAYLPTLARIAAALNRFPGDLTITGHTDDQPVSTNQFRSNMALSVARADAVRQRLLTANLSGERSINIAGAGDTQPIDANTTPAGRAHNRRVDIVLSVPRGGVSNPSSRPA